MLANQRLLHAPYRFISYQQVKCMAAVGLPACLTADAFQARAAEADGSIAAIHPDWHLLLNASYLAMAHPKFRGHTGFGSLGRMVRLVEQLALNIPAQQTAAALVCSLHHSHIEHAPSEQGRFQLLQAAVDDGELDGILMTVASIFQAS